MIVANKLIITSAPYRRAASVNRQQQLVFAGAFTKSGEIVNLINRVSPIVLNLVQWVFGILLVLAAQTRELHKLIGETVQKSERGFDLPISARTGYRAVRAHRSFVRYAQAISSPWKQPARIPSRYQQALTSG